MLRPALPIVCYRARAARRLAVLPLPRWYGEQRLTARIHNHDVSSQTTHPQCTHIPSEHHDTRHSTVHSGTATRKFSRIRKTLHAEQENEDFSHASLDTENR